MSPQTEQPVPKQQKQARKVIAANLPVVDEDTASQEVQDLYQRFREEFGRLQVPGILQCFATHPPLLKHMLGVAKEMLFTEGALGRQNKELISAFVSAHNQCEYCADSHASAFRMHGGAQGTTQCVLACDLQSQDLTEQQRALLHFALEVTTNSHALTAADMDNLRLAGFNDLQIAEAIHVSSLFATFNRVVNAFGLPSQGLLDAFEQEQVAHG